jgi:C_GCAxxG_C_C family probable redox protein
MDGTSYSADARRSAETLFASGHYCAESVVLALAKAQGLQSDLLPRVATAFCSGMSRSRGPCGALTGAIMGVSLALGRNERSDSVQPAYAATQEVIRQFEAEFGSRDCHLMLGCDLNTPEGQAIFREQQLGRHCAQFTGRATEIAASVIWNASNAS